MCRTSWQESVLLRDWQPYGSDTPTQGRMNLENACLLFSIQNLFILVFYFNNWKLKYTNYIGCWLLTVVALYSTIF
jgi:hypothetical protein